MQRTPTDAASESSFHTAPSGTTEPGAVSQTEPESSDSQEAEYLRAKVGLLEHQLAGLNHWRQEAQVYWQSYVDKRDAEASATIANVRAQQQRIEEKARRDVEDARRELDNVRNTFSILDAVSAERRMKKERASADQRIRGLIAQLDEIASERDEQQALLDEFASERNRQRLLISRQRKALRDQAQELLTLRDERDDALMAWRTAHQRKPRRRSTLPSIDKDVRPVLPDLVAQLTHVTPTAPVVDDGTSLGGDSPTETSLAMERSFSAPTARQTLASAAMAVSPSQRELPTRSEAVRMAQLGGLALSPTGNADAFDPSSPRAQPLRSGPVSPQFNLDLFAPAGSRTAILSAVDRGSAQRSFHALGNLQDRAFSRPRAPRRAKG